MHITLADWLIVRSGAGLRVSGTDFGMGKETKLPSVTKIYRDVYGHVRALDRSGIAHTLI